LKKAAKKRQVDFRSIFARSAWYFEDEDVNYRCSPTHIRSGSLMDLEATLHLLAEDPTTPVDVAEVALLLSTDEFPDLDVPGYLTQLDELAKNLGSRLHGNLSTQVQILSDYLFEEMGFRGNINEYYDPRNSYLNEVIDRKLGIPITLAVLTMSIGRRAGIEIVGVGLPGHFLVNAIDDRCEILFDPFHEGEQLSIEKAEQLIQAVTHQPFQITPEFLLPTPPGYILLRMLNNLKSIYVDQSDYQRAARVITRICTLSPNDWNQQRDLGFVLWQSGRFGACIDPFSRYLKANPQASDSTDVSELLERAKKEIARWN
jgi:regulator of sirC expression with transglutaminase-like and TPR domain